MGSLEKLLELKHSRWSLLWFCCPFSVLPLPSGSMQAQCPELSLPLVAWSNNRPGSWVSSSTLLMPLLMWLAGRRGPCPFLEPSLSFPWRATHRLRPNGTGLFKLTRLSLLPTKPNLLEGRRGPTLLPAFPFQEPPLLLLSPLSRLLSGTMLSSSRLKMKLLLLENEKLSTLV